MKYYLSSDVLQHLVFGNKKEQEKLKEEILDLLKKDSRFFTSVFSLQRLVSINTKHSDAIVHELITLCDEVVSVHLDDIKLANSLRKEYNLTEIESLDLAISIRTCDCILGYHENLKTQKLIRFICLASESKVHRF
ncbi:MAG: hypothetical protein N3A69_08685 [Leptospiraceae bacterium]|nr:hypothetical protein [Leptospiraceae bacterium]